MSSRSSSAWGWVGLGGDASEVGGGGDSREIDESGAGTGAQAMQQTLLLPRWYSPANLLVLCCYTAWLPRAPLGPSKR